MSWAAHDTEPYAIQRHTGIKVAFVPLLIGSYAHVLHHYPYDLGRSTLGARGAPVTLSPVGAVVSGTAVIRPIEPTRVATTGSATVSVLTAPVRLGAGEAEDDEDRERGARVGEDEGVHGRGDVVAPDAGGVLDEFALAE